MPTKRTNKNFLSGYFAEKADSNELDIFEALEAQSQILADVEQADNDFAAGNSVKATPEMFDNIRKGSYLRRN